MSVDPGIKKEIVHEAIERIRQQVISLEQDHKQNLIDTNAEDIDKGDVAESPKEQMMDEYLAQGLPLAHLNSVIEELAHVALQRFVNTVSPGALVKTNAGYFLVQVAFPEFSWKGNKIVGISIESPFYQKMQGLKALTKFDFQERHYEIHEIL